MNHIVVGITEFKFAESPHKLVTYGLGSCVAITCYAKEAIMGSMAHVLLPHAYSAHDNEAPGKFADSAVAAMVQQMEIRGIGPSRLIAKIAGGADMFAGKFMGSDRCIGARNILAARKALDKFGIRLVAQDVGGTAGRTVEFATESGLLVVRTLRGEVKQL
ncbi:MAG: chemotaxis protein CheD [bacterium]|nr:chemotaxis protein CheD [bacterium]MDT8365217.1 chemotaxis protein CheD [bacterium]